MKMEKRNFLKTAFENHFQMCDLKLENYIFAKTNHKNFMILIITFVMIISNNECKKWGSN